VTSTLRGMNSILLMNGGKRTKARFKAGNVARKILGPVGLWLSMMLLLGSPIAGEAGRNLPWVDGLAGHIWWCFHHVGGSDT